MTDGRALLDVRRRPSTEDDEWRASWTELFFDLVFVLVVTQLSAYLYARPEPARAAETLFLLLVAWWAWLYTTWATNWFDPERGPVRGVLVVAMFASMLGAVAIPEAFGDRALLLVVGYVSIQTVRNAFAVLATRPDDPLHRPLVRYSLWSLWVGAALAHGRVRAPRRAARRLADRAGLRLRRPARSATGPRGSGARTRATGSWSPRTSQSG